MNNPNLIAKSSGSLREEEFDVPGIYDQTARSWPLGGRSSGPH